MPIAATKPTIQSALTAFQTKPFKDAALAFLSTLGYSSERTVDIGSIDEFCKQFDPGGFLDHPSALKSDWKSLHLLFQLTDEDLSSTASLFKETDVQPGLFKSYLFFAIELTGEHYARGKLTAIARQLNRIFPMPVMVLIKHLADKKPVLSIAVINRRRNKREEHKDVLGKVTIIRDIALERTHRGHLDILDSLAVGNLVHPEKKPINDFDTLHAAWEQIFNSELLNNRFYKELSNWYFWALPQVDFPADLEPDAEKRRATGLIRLLTRLIFCWFLKEKDGLIPEKLFHPTDLAKILKGFDPESETSSTYYQAILQNLFFATLNQRMGKDGKGKPYRGFAADEGFLKNKSTYDVNNLFRYEKLFAVAQDEALALFADIPFLNGGLFECLDRTEDGTDKKRYLDGFSRNPRKRPHVPDRLFFDSGETADLSAAYGDKKRKAEKVTGLISILNRYKFTIVENTPIDQEIALDPELLGKVFENLLASYNEETKTTARKQTGSFYTPRPIVDYMVDESLKAHLQSALEKNVAGAARPSSNGQKDKGQAAPSTFTAKLNQLFSYTDEPHQLTDYEVATLITAIDEVKILDPACGSGAFPMGVLHKLVYCLSKLDPQNVEWEKLQIAKVQEISDTEERRRKLAEIASNFADNNDDYGRKLYLIENCLYGVDIQPIAIQITKLRFFISLVCDQKTNRSKKDNHGIRPLPNLETKFVAANTLIGLPEMDQMELVDPRVYKIEADIETLYHSHFSIQRRDQKLAVQGRVKALRKEMADLLAQSLMSRKKSEHIAEWDPFDPQSSADFFDPHWMFGRSLKDGFDIVIGNPPYGAFVDLELRKVFAEEYGLPLPITDSYVLFFLVAIRHLSVNGIRTFITPSTWLYMPSYVRLRRALLSQLKIRRVVLFREPVFEAVVECCIELAEKSISQSYKFSFNEVTIESPLLESTTSEVDATSVINSTDSNIVPLSNSETARLFERLKEQFQPLGSCCIIVCGLTPYRKGKGKPPQSDEIVETKAFDADYKVSKTYRQYIIGRDFHRYVWKIQNERWISYGDWLAEPRYKAPFNEDLKIVVRQTADSIIATIDDRKFLSLKNVHNLKVIHPRIDEYFVLGLLNSRLISWWYQLLVPERGRVFAEVKVVNLQKIPLCTPDKNTRDFGKMSLKVASGVKEILALKYNENANTRALEAEIDQQVYALYGLTPEEIAIVEGTAP